MKTFSEMEMEKEKMLAEEKAKLEQAMQESTAQGLGDDERQRMIEQAESNIKKLEVYMDKEKMRQEDDLKAQLEERRRKKAERLKAQHERKEKQEALITEGAGWPRFGGLWQRAQASSTRGGVSG